MTLQKKKFFSQKISHKLMDAEDEEKILYLDFGAGSNLEIDHNGMIKLGQIHRGVEEFCKDYSTEFYLEWEKDKEKGIGGNIKIDLTMKNLFEEDLSYFYDEEMIDDNEDIAYFRPFDYATPEAQCGFVIKPNEIYPSVYYNQAGRSTLHNLDLDYHGYTEMAVEARVFYHWQRVILHYDGWEYGEWETSFFKEHMPKIFDDWTWEGFIERYESLRLSNK